MSEMKALQLLGLAERAHKVASGEFSTEKALQNRKARLVLVTEDASENTRKKFTDKCRFAQVPILIIGTKSTLGHSIGKMDRSSCAVLDAGLAGAIMKEMSASPSESSEAAREN